nr:YbhB/YbcL family Raf kinase inhibitor-like protein [Phaeacidiphilus oryzae]
MPANPLGVLLRNRRAGQQSLQWARPELRAPENFTLTSPAFEHQAPIPEKYRGRMFGPNISPALEWTTPPAGTAELVLIAEDPDVPLGKPALHALTLGIDSALPGLPENALAEPSPVPGLRHGKGASAAAAGRGRCRSAHTGRTPTSSSSSPSTGPPSSRPGPPSAR